MMAGLFPIKHQVNKLMKKACLRTCTLHLGHPTRAHLGTPWRVSSNNIVAPMPLTGQASKDGITSMTHISISGQACNEKFDTLNDECRPGERVQDAFSRQVTYHLDEIDGAKALPKSERDAMSDWINAKLTPLVLSIEDDEESVLVFTDGSQKKDDNILAKVSAGAAWIVRHADGRTSQGRVGCGQATPYDAEMIALARGLSEATTRISERIKNIHVFADNQAALTSILAATGGSSQMVSVAACQTARRWLARSEDHHIHIWWCPGHRGVYWNEKVDKEAGLAATKPCNSILFAYAHQCITAQTYKAWQSDMKRPEYRGHHLLIQNSDMFDKCKHTSANWFLKTAGQNTTYIARLVRFVSGHFPHGAFRERFKFEGNVGCWCGQTAVETRDHVWFDCELWIRKHKPPDLDENPKRQGAQGRSALDMRPATPPGMTRREHILQEWRYELPELQDLAEFLRLNPIVGTFQWLELIDRAVADYERGEARSVAIIKAQLFTTLRKQVYEQWAPRNPGKPLTEFNLWYGAAALQHLADAGPTDERSELQTLIDLGVPQSTAKEHLQERNRP